ncbi:MAG: glutamate-1-semialdehyde 2,1-aminomutase [Ignavibacteriales bacterium]|nr:MAG: glutamate-1-semialdehyde 2,1-aminomutase [Ignavibacteriales bacterium]
MQISTSKQLFEKAQTLIPGGVNSPVRAFKSVGGTPVFFASGSGARVTDVDGNSYLDYIGSWGPHLFGHNPEFIKAAILNQLEKGVSFGAPCGLEVEMAELITSLVPSVEMVRMVNSGTEATMSAIRAARGFTGRDKFIKFEGCYHGHGDYFLIKAGSGALTLGVPTSPGVTKGNAADTLLATYNNLQEVEELAAKYKGEIAAIIIEPVVGNMGTVLPSKEFMTGLRELCTKEGIVLIFDEVMTGFRLAKGGAQEVFDITPDMSVFGKIIGGGLPVGAYGGKKEIMMKVAPAGPVYQAGTLSGNPLAMAAGLAALRYIQQNPGIYTRLEALTLRLHKGLEAASRSAGKNYTINRVGSMISMFFTEHPVTDFASAVTSDTALYGKFFHGMLEEGHYLPPAQYEAWFVSTAHTEADIDETIAAAGRVLKKIL